MTISHSLPRRDEYESLSDSVAHLLSQNDPVFPKAARYAQAIPIDSFP